MGIFILGAFALYLLIAIGVVIWSVSYAKKRSKSVWRWGLGAAFVMYLIPFWDWLPTLAMHRYYCATEAGFWAYKTVDQWKAENPGVMQTLVATKGAPSTRQGDLTNYIDTYVLNQRFIWVVSRSRTPLFYRWRHEQKVVDAKTNEVLVRYVDFSTAQARAGGGWYGWKIWLHNEHCPDGVRNESLIRQTKNRYRGTER